MFYEHLKANLEKELTYLMEFLGVPIDPNRLKCTVESNMQAKFKRQVSQDVHFMCDWISLRSCLLLHVPMYTSEVASPTALKYLL